ncbi:hypothetical protein WJ69_00030 [Burkholderia ubonensis]|nr:hypothetical protein WJ69_00030 [Burkholderia ubonensis]
MVVIIFGDGCNPWASVTDASVVKRVRKLQVERALPLDLWTRVRATLAERSELQGPSGPRWRAARALLLVMGDGGLWIAEAAAMARAALVSLSADDDSPAGWLAARGSRQGQQTTLRADQRRVRRRVDTYGFDRGQYFDAVDAVRPLIEPLVVPPMPHA